MVVLVGLSEMSSVCSFFLLELLQYFPSYPPFWFLRWDLNTVTWPALIDPPASAASLLVLRARNTMPVICFLTYLTHCFCRSQFRSQNKTNFLCMASCLTPALFVQCLLFSRQWPFQNGFKGKETSGSPDSKCVWPEHGLLSLCHCAY